MKILIIDDDAKFASYLEKDLHATYGHNVTWQKSADMVLMTIKEFDFDAIILDIMMPIPETWNREEKDEADFGLSTGLVLHEKIRTLNPTIPILIYSAKSVAIENDEYTKVFRKPALNYEINEILISMIKTINDEK